MGTFKPGSAKKSSTSRSRFSAGTARGGAKGGARGTGSERSRTAHVIDVQRTAGNRAVVQALGDSDGGQEADAASKHSGWDALNADFWQLTKRLLTLNNAAPLVGSRTQILDRVHAMHARIGEPRPADLALFQLRVELDGFKKTLERESAQALAQWPAATVMYAEERARLEKIGGRVHELALGYLDRQFEYSSQRVAAAGQDVIASDVAGIAEVIGQGSHLSRAKQDAAAEIVAEARPGRKPGEMTTWPWPPFKASQLLAEGGEHGVHRVMHLLDTAVEHQIGNAARNMLEAGIPKQDVTAWTEAVRRDVIRKLKPVDRAVAKSLAHGHKLSVRLQLFAYATVALDVGISTADVIAQPPGKRLRLAAYHVGRIAGGLAGASAVGKAGARFGSRFGLAGAVIGGLGGAVIGGLGGAFLGKKTLVFIHDKVWPPTGTTVVIN